MSIDPDAIYQSFNFHHLNKNTNWTIRGPLSGDLVAGLLLGMLIGFVHLTEKWEENINAFLDTLDPKTRKAMTNEQLDNVLIQEGFDIDYPYESVQIVIFPLNVNKPIVLNYTNISKVLANHYFVGQEPIPDSPGKMLHYQPLRPPAGEFGWTMHEGHNQYVLYSFRTVDFVQGFISTCNAFQIDFRDYVIGVPFKYDPITHTRSLYRIEGYDIPTE